MTRLFPVRIPEVPISSAALIEQLTAGNRPVFTGLDAMTMMQLLRLAMDAGEAYYQCRPAGLGIYASDFAGQITIPPWQGGRTSCPRLRSKHWRCGSGRI